MRFVNINPNGSEWRWFTLPGTAVDLELKLPTARELKECPEAEEDFGDAQRRFIAERWFRDFRGIEDAADRPVANTPEMRFAILQDPRVFAFAALTLNRFALWSEQEKKEVASG